MYLHFYTFPLHNLFEDIRYIVSYSTLFYSVICTQLIFTLFFIVTDSFLLCFTYFFSYFSFPLSLIDCDVLTLSISLDPFSSAPLPSAPFFSVLPHSVSVCFVPFFIVCFFPLFHSVRVFHSYNSRISSLITLLIELMASTQLQKQSI